MKKFLIVLMAIGVTTFYSCKKEGCTDPAATNFNSKAKKDNGTCEFANEVVSDKLQVRVRSTSSQAEKNDGRKDGNAIFIANHCLDVKYEIKITGAENHSGVISKESDNIFDVILIDDGPYKIEITKIEGSNLLPNCSGTQFTYSDTLTEDDIIDLSIGLDD